MSTRLTFLADNTVMELIPDSERTVRLSKPGTNFLAEHGFSVLISTEDGKQILFDAGVSRDVVPHNLSLLGLDIGTDIDSAALSHGHSDHTGCVSRLNCPIHAHPAAIGNRYLTRGGEIRFDLTSRDLNTLVGRLELSTEPTELAPGVWTTGEIPRPNEWERPKGFVRDEGGRLAEDPVPDDQAIAITTPKGLVVVAGCAHAGLINTIRHAQEVTGQSKVHAVVGGFHLIDAGPEKMANTLEALEAIDPDILAPTHCTGFHATAKIAAAFGPRFEYITGGHQLALS